MFNRKQTFEEVKKEVKSLDKNSLNMIIRLAQEEMRRRELRLIENKQESTFLIKKDRR